MELLVAIITTLGLLLVPFVKWFLEKRDSLRKHRQTIKGVEKIYEALNDLLYNVGATRCVVVRISNGGAPPTARTQQFSNVLYEVVGDETMPIKKLWTGVPMDEVYVKVVSQMYDDGAVELCVKDLAPGALSDLYSASRIKKVYKYLLWADHKALYYMSVQWNNEGRVISGMDRNYVREAARRITAVLNANV